MPEEKKKKASAYDYLQHTPEYTRVTPTLNKELSRTTLMLSKMCLLYINNAKKNVLEVAAEKTFGRFIALSEMEVAMIKSKYI